MAFSPGRIVKCVSGINAPPPFEMSTNTQVHLFCGLRLIGQVCPCRMPFLKTNFFWVSSASEISLGSTTKVFCLLCAVAILSSEIAASAINRQEFRRFSISSAA